MPFEIDGARLPDDEAQRLFSKKRATRYLKEPLGPPGKRKTSRVVLDTQALSVGFAALLGKGVAQLTKGLAGLIAAFILDWRLAGIAIVRKALQSPVRQIADNAGVEGSIVVGKVLESRSASFGYDAQNDEYGDMIEKGIIDPAKVVRTALQDAASVSGLMVTTEAGVADAPKKEGAGGAPAMPDMGGMGGMGGMM